MSSNDFLQALSEDRSKDAKVLKKPQYAGIMNMVTELYPDNAHFIYELLQNAEDTEATEINFTLASEKLVAEHNGARLFTENDVESITSIGNSTKRDDVTSIGKFGVGFKAVFSYTDTPIVYSGDFSFRIRDLVVPELIPPLTKRTNTTIFEFPFNNSKKTASLAIREIEKGLCALGNNTLLFLSHIRKINYSLPDGSQGSLKRIDHENGRIEIRAKHPHSDETVSHWLHFHKDVAVADSDEKEKTCRVAIAYQLEKVTDKNKDSETWKIIPVHGGGQVSIYFPAVKENSKLNFHIHAPFASTVARDVVRDTPENKILIKHLSELIADSFIFIRDAGMLTMDFLAVLPNTINDGIGWSSIYYSIVRHIIHAFKTQQLTPTKSGEFECGKNLYRGSSKISSVITDSDLAQIALSESDWRYLALGYDWNSPTIKKWAANAPLKNQRADNFLETLEIDEWNFDKLLAVFKNLTNSESSFFSDTQEKEFENTNLFRQSKIKSWFEQKDDNWMRSFYALLSEAHNRLEWAKLDFSLVRVESNGEIKHVKGSEAYFSNFSNDSVPQVYFVKNAVYSKKDGVDGQAQNFLGSIGVKPSFDKQEAIKLRLKFYQATPPEDFTSQYYNDITNFISYWKTNKGWFHEYSYRDDIKLFKSVKFLLDDGLNCRCAEDLCLDKPFFETGLIELTEIHKKAPLSQEYLKYFSEDEQIDFVEFLKALGVMYKLKIEPCGSYFAHKNPNNPYKDKKLNPHSGTDFFISELHKYLDVINKNSSAYKYAFLYLDDGTKRNLRRETALTTASRLIWEALFDDYYKNHVLIDLKGDIRNAFFKPVHKPEEKFESFLITELKTHAWIPTKSGEFRKPQDMTRDDLRDDFIFDDRNGLLTAIEFGKNAIDLAEEQRRQNEQSTASFEEKEKIAKESGFESVDEMKDGAELLKIIKAKGKTPAEIMEFLNPKKPDFEDDYSSNPARRAGKVQETAVDAPEKRTEMRERSVAVDNTETKKAAKSYLRDRYTDDDKMLYCQICKKEMPFKLSDGSHYFEAVQLINNLPNRHRENYIALCPTDAAKFQYANPSKDKICDLVNTLIEDRSPNDINDSDEDENCFDIVLAGNTETVQFRRVHLIDLKAILSNK